MLLLPRLRVGTSTVRFLCAFPVRWRSHRLYRGSRSTLTWARSLFKIFGAMGCLGSRHGNILFHVPFFLSSRFSFSGVLFFRMGSWPAVKRVIYPVSCMTGSCTLWEFQSLRFTWCLFLRNFPYCFLLHCFTLLQLDIGQNRFGPAIQI